MRFFFILAMVCMFLSLVACGGGGGGSEPVRPETRVLRGVVEDGPIAGARVSLLDHDRTILRRCGAAGDQLCTSPSITGREGLFSIPIPPDLDVAGLEVVAEMREDALDQATGLVLRRMQMSAPLDLFHGRKIVVSPLTTLIAKRVAAGDGLAQASERVRQWLDLPPGYDLAVRPSQDAEILRRALILSRIAVEISSHGDGFQVLAAQVGEGVPLIRDGKIEEAVFQNHVPESARAWIATLYQEMSGANEALEEVFRDQELVFRFTNAIRDAFSGELAEEDIEELVAKEKIKDLVEQILAAAGEAVIPLDVYHIHALLKHIRQFYLFGKENLSFSLHNGLLLAEDPGIRDILQLRYLFDIGAKLEDADLLRTEAERLRYYFNSNHPRWVRAEKLAWAALDDRAAGVILLKTMKGKSGYGFVGILDNGRFENVPFGDIPPGELFRRVREELEYRIFDDEFRARTYREVAINLIRFGYSPEALEALGEAERLFKNVIENRNFNINSDDFRFLYKLSRTYRQGGAQSAAASVLADMENLSLYLKTVATIGQAVVAYKEMADELIAEERYEEARLVVETMYGLAAETPPAGTSYLGRVIYLRDTAQRFADLGDWDKVEEIYREVQGLRYNSDGTPNPTAGGTWSIMPSFVEFLYRGGDHEGALALAESFPVEKASDRKRALMLVLTYETINGSVERALDDVEKYFTTDGDRVEALTYFAQAQASPGIAKSLINAGQLAAAEYVLDEALKIVAAMAPQEDKDRYILMVQLGYVKLADLYRQVSNIGRATDLLGQARMVARGLFDGMYRASSLIDIAGPGGDSAHPTGYFGLGDQPEARSALQEALDAAGTLVFPTRTAKELADLYTTITKAALGTGDFEIARTAIKSLLDWARALAEDTSNNKKIKSDYFFEASRFYVLADPSRAIEPLLEAQAIADAIPTDTIKWGRYIDENIRFKDPIGGSDRRLIPGYAYAGDYDEALRLAERLPLSYRDKALVWLADYLCSMDDLPGATVADVDTDGDGLPDFFHPLATSSERFDSGLSVDPDSDGDGIDDPFDRRPLYVGADDRVFR